MLLKEIHYDDFHAKPGDKFRFRDPGMAVSHWIYIIIGFVVLFVVIVALYNTLYDKASQFGNKTGAIGAVVVLLLPVLLAVGILLLFVRNFLPKKSY